MKVARPLLAILFLACIWSLFIVGAFFLNKSKSQSFTNVPKNATVIVKIDGSRIIKSSFFAILMEANDPDVTSFINSLIKEKSRSIGDNKSLGIAFLSEIAIYIVPDGKNQILGVNFNLKRPEYSRKNFKNILKPNQVFEIEENKGVLLQFIGKKNINTIEKLHLHKLAKSISKTKVTFLEKNHENRNEIIDIKTVGNVFGNSTIFNHSNLNFLLETHTISMNGILDFNPSYLNKLFNPSKVLSPDGFHFSSSLIPSKVQDTLTSILYHYEINLPPISRFSLNLRGSSIQNSDHGLIYSPDMDLHISFEEKINLKAILENKSFLKKLKLTWNDNELTNGFQKYYCLQTDSKSILISSKKSINWAKDSENQCFRMEGKLSAITNFSGDKMILFFLENLPIFKSSKELLEKTEMISIDISKHQNTSARLKGAVNFKENYYPMNDFFKFAIDNDVIRLKK